MAGAESTLACLVLALAAVFTTRATAHDPITTKVTWSREISRIALRRCAGCHAPGGVAPMPLVTYAQARPWAAAIRNAVVTRRMPPWPAARGFGEFANDPTLSPFELSLVDAWAGGGAPEGLARDLPRAESVASVPAAASASPVVSRARLRWPRRVEAPNGGETTVTLGLRGDGDRWLVGWRFAPNDGAIVHAAFRVAGGGSIGDWTAPENSQMFPAGAARRIPGVAEIEATFRVRGERMQQDFPLARPARSPELELMFAGTPPARELRDLDLACQTQTVAFDGELLAVRPATAGDGGSIGVALASPGAAPLPILWVARVDRAYQPTYRLQDPLPLRRGARLEIRSADSECTVRLLVARPLSASAGPARD